MVIDKIRVAVKKPLPKRLRFIAISTVVGALLLLDPDKNTNFYLSLIFLLIALLGMTLSAVAAVRINSAKYPAKTAVIKAAWRYLLTVVTISILFLLPPVILDDSFSVLPKRYFNMHIAVLAMFAIAVLMLVTGKKQAEKSLRCCNAKIPELRSLCLGIYALKERVKLLPDNVRSDLLRDLQVLYCALRDSYPITNTEVIDLDRVIMNNIQILTEWITELPEDVPCTAQLHIHDLVRSIGLQLQERNRVLEQELRFKN